MSENKAIDDSVKLFERLQHDLSELATLIRTESKLDAVVFKLPFPYRDQSIPQTVVPMPLLDKPAREEAIKAIQAIRLEPEQKGHASVRAPGVLHAGTETIKLAEKINQIKEDFEQCFKQIADKQSERHKLFAMKVKYFAYHQTTRKLVIYNEPVNKIYFNWIVNADVNNKKVVGDLCRQIEKDMKYPPKDVSSEAWQEQLQDELKVLARFSDKDILIKKKKLTPYPVCSVYPVRLADPDGQAKRNYEKKMASLPVLCAQDYNPDPIPIKPLPAMDTRIRRAARSDRQVAAHPLLPRLNIYNYV